MFERRCELIELDFVRVLLRCVRARMPHQRLQRDEVATALAEKPVCKTMSQLVRRETANTSPQRIRARPFASVLDRLMAASVLPPALSLVTTPTAQPQRQRCGRQAQGLLHKGCTESTQYIRVNRQPLPVPAFAEDPHATPNEVNVSPSAPDDFDRRRPIPSISRIARRSEPTPRPERARARQGSVDKCPVFVWAAAESCVKGRNRLAPQPPPRRRTSAEPR